MQDLPSAILWDLPWRRLVACLLAAHKKASIVAGLKGGSR